MTRRSGEAPPQASSELSPEEAAEDFLKRLPVRCRLLVALSGGAVLVTVVLSRLFFGAVRPRF